MTLFFSFCSWVLYIYTHHIFFIHASVVGHLGCSHILPIVNGAAINIGHVYPFELWFSQGICQPYCFAFLFSKCTLNWRITALQYGVGFCHTSTWISHGFACDPSLWGLPPASHAVPPLWVGTEPWLEPPSHTADPRWLCVFQTVVCMYPRCSLRSSHPVSRSRFSMSAPLLLPCKQAHPDHVSRVHTFALIYAICSSPLTYFTLYDQLQGSSTSLELTQMCSFLWLISHCMYIPQLLYPFICRWTSRLLPCLKWVKWKWSRSVVSDSLRPRGLWPTRFLRPWDSPGKDTGVGCHLL